MVLFGYQEKRRKYSVLLKKLRILGWKLDLLVIYAAINYILVIRCLFRLEQETLENMEVQAIQKIRSDKLVDMNINGDPDNQMELLENEEFEEEEVIDMWVVRNSQNEGSSQIEILSYEYNLNCTSKKVINVCPGKIEMLCVYNENQVWCVDSSKCLYIYW